MALTGSQQTTSKKLGRDDISQESLPAVSIIVPVYNESESIGSVLSGLVELANSIDKARVEIICVNDCSEDGSEEIIEKFIQVNLLHNIRNVGYGASLKKGIEASSGEYVVIVDGDGTYPIENLPAFIEDAVSGFDMIVGARFGEGIDCAKPRRVARKVLKLFVQALTGTRVPDLNSGFRIFTRELYDSCAHLLPNGFSFTTTITMASLFSDRQICYRPIYYDIRAGSSHINPIRDFFRFFIIIMRMAVYFNPLKVFVPIFSVMLVLGIAKGVRDVFVVGYVGNLSVLLLVTAIQIFLSGLIADVMARGINAKEKVATNARLKFQSQSNVH